MPSTLKIQKSTAIKYCNLYIQGSKNVKHSKSSKSYTLKIKKFYTKVSISKKILHSRFKNFYTQGSKKVKSLYKFVSFLSKNSYNQNSYNNDKFYKF